MTTDANQFHGRDIEEWLKARKLGVTGTDVGKIMGLSKWGSAQDVWEDKMGLKPPIDDNESMLWGRLLEPLVLSEYARRNCVNVIKPEGVTIGKEDWMIGSPDGIVIADDKSWQYGVEVKTTRSMKTFQVNVPLDYEYQCRWYMMISDLPYWDVVALIQGSTYHEQRIQRDNDLEEEMIDRCRDFWFNNVMAKCPPNPSVNF